MVTNRLGVRVRAIQALNYEIKHNAIKACGRVEV
jgi:hypothetical protein